MKIVIVKQPSFHVLLSLSKSLIFLNSYSWNVAIGKDVRKEAAAITRLRDDECLNQDRGSMDGGRERFLTHSGE